LGVEVVEIGRHLIEENKDRLTAFEELEPVLFVRGLGPTSPECLELISLAELTGNFPPEEIVGVVASVEGSDAGLLKSPCGQEARTVFVSE